MSNGYARGFAKACGFFACFAMACGTRDGQAIDAGSGHDDSDGGSEIDGSTGAVDGSTGAVDGSTGAVDGSTGAVDAGGVPSFGPHRIAVGASALGDVMRSDVQCTIFDYPGGTDYLGSGDCHTQGIAPTTLGVVASCQDRDDDLGIVVRFDGALEDHGDGGKNDAVWTVLYEPQPAAPRSHVVVGQGLKPLAERDLIPAVSSDSQAVPGEVMLLDIDEPICSFIHDPGSGDRHLGASSLTSLGDTIYLATCSWDCDRFFVYSVDPSQPDCAPTLEASLAVGASGDLRIDAGAGDNNWGAYNSLVLLAGPDDEVFLLAGHGGWLDTWELSGFPGPGITFRKLAKYQWGRNQANHNNRGMFYEGMAIETPSETELRLWAAPHDFGLGGCGQNRSCMRAIYRCDISL